MEKECVSTYLYGIIGCVLCENVAEYLPKKKKGHKRPAFELQIAVTVAVLVFVVVGDFESKCRNGQCEQPEG